MQIQPVTSYNDLDCLLDDAELMDSMLDYYTHDIHKFLQLHEYSRKDLKTDIRILDEFTDFLTIDTIDFLYPLIVKKYENIHDVTLLIYSQTIHVLRTFFGYGEREQATKFIIQTMQDIELTLDELSVAITKSKI